MHFTCYESASEMLEKVEHFLMRKEARHNLPLGILKQKAKDEKSNYAMAEDLFLAIGENEQNEVEVVLIRTASRNLIICGHLSAVKKAAHWLNKKGVQLPGVVGCTDTAKAFADEWSKVTTCKTEATMKQNIYQLEKLRQFQRNPGKLTYATEDDIALVMSWTEEFEKEALGLTEHPTLERDVLQEIRNNRVFFWRDTDCTPVSMAKRARELKNGVVVNFVYTPDEYQRKGYATTCVGALSERLLNEGFKFCSLNTNAENPTSNSIYMSIGYEPVGDAVEYRFHYV
ncbi:GNAT family N-acetyltransferase [Salipaludibacillus keqinensis]|nr:GNAT family N-acetyltransferase [Salipaludibacillus keqinensis]